MVIRPVVIAVICVGLFLILESLMMPKAMALKTNGFRMEDLRTHKRRNYILQRARDREIKKRQQERGASYDAEEAPSDAGRTFREQLAYIADYANTIDGYFLDNSVETRIMKRDNNEAIWDPPCSCDSVDKVVILGDDVFPTSLAARTCKRGGDTSGCASPYKCLEIHHYVPILKKISRCNSSMNLADLVPEPLRRKWCADTIEIPVGCQCAKKYTATTMNQKK